ncbi:hypothetical protein EMPS_07266 [Entomortierella parvispora]|uniref:SEC7 domain-containing protein n=1 Tax=Entomortierella parvispora TaxID=205924 RepID=A0A9P3HE90_9FUNG|nr:hypothetical protein EMPS_07266 [Entomortierella parvispora]
MSDPVISSFAPGHDHAPDHTSTSHVHLPHSSIARSLTSPPRIHIPQPAAINPSSPSPYSAASSHASSLNSPASSSPGHGRASLGHSPHPSSSSVHRQTMQQRQSYHGRARLGNTTSAEAAVAAAAGGHPALARTPRRDSSLPFPLPSVLPALPPLIPVTPSPSSSPMTSPMTLAQPPSTRSPGATLLSTLTMSSSPASAQPALPSGTSAVAQPMTVAPHPSQKQQKTSQEQGGRSSTDTKRTEGGSTGPGTPKSLLASGSGGAPSGSEPVLGSNHVSGSLSSAPGEERPPAQPYSQHPHPQPHPHHPNPQQQKQLQQPQPQPQPKLQLQRQGSLDGSLPSNAVAPQEQQWPESPRVFLDRIKETVSKAELGNLLSKGTDAFHLAVLRTHMESFDFRRDPIDLALRKFLLDFHFPKEAQQIDRVLEAFAGRYHGCNPHLFRSADVVYTLAFSLMLLHTDAHNKNVRYKMTREQYVRQAKSIDGVNTIPADILEVLYDNITYLKFVYAEDEMDVDGQRLADVQPPATSWFPRRRTASSQRIDSYNMIRQGSIAHLAPDLSDLIPFRWPYYWKGTIEMVDNVQINNQFTRAPMTYVPGLRSRRHSQNYTHAGRPPLTGLGAGAAVHPELIPSNECDSRRTAEEEMDGAAELKLAKFGILSRKIDLEHGRKSSVRGWRDLGVILSGSQLLFFTELAWFQQQRAALPGFDPRAPPEVDGYFASELGGGPPPMPQALISTMNSIAVVDSGYQKYPHVFRLVCPNGKQYLFRADSEHEMNDWMARINYASAFKTAGVRLRNYRVAWASDVVWIKDEQGRHQLRRKLRADPGEVVGPIEGRTQLIQVKMKDIDREINACSASLAAELRLARGLEVMIPLQTVTRQRIVQSATLVGKRLRHLMLERTKLDCFRTILERDLALVPSNCYVQDERYRWANGQPTQPSDCLSGTTQYSRSSAPTAVDDHLDLAREEYVLDSSRTSSSSLYSGKGLARPRLNLPEFHRTVSENVLDEHRRSRIVKETDIPQGPAAIQAAIIEAARGGNGSNGGMSSTLSSPDPNRYQDKSPRKGHPPPSPSSGKTFLTPDSPDMPMGRSRALSMPGERPNRMPRTVSIYSSSSQTANKLKRLFEQGLGHLKWGSGSSSHSSAIPPIPSIPVPSSLSMETTFDPSEIAEARHSVRDNTTGPPSPRTDDYSKLSTGSHPDIIRTSHSSHSVSFAEDLDAPALRIHDLSNVTLESSGSSSAGSGSTESEETVASTLPESTETMATVTTTSSVSDDTSATGLGIMAADEDVDNGEDEVVIDRSIQQHAQRATDPSFSSSTSLERSFVMMVSTDYVTEADNHEDSLDNLEDADLDDHQLDQEGDDQDDDDEEVDAQEMDDYKEAGLHEEYKAARLLTSDLSLSLSLDMPALSTMLDNEDSWHTIP